MFMDRPLPGLRRSAARHAADPHRQGCRLRSASTADRPSARRMLAGLSMRLHSLIADVESYSLRSSAQRVIGYLLQQAPDDEQGPTEITLPTSKQVIASRLNLTPETLSRIFHDLTDGRPDRGSWTSHHGARLAPAAAIRPLKPR